MICLPVTLMRAHPIAKTRPKSALASAFTLVELLVSMVVLAAILVLMLSVVSQVQQVWKRTSASVEQFRESRNAFEVISRQLQQATLNSYWDYNSTGTIAPTKYIRQSNLRFISGPADALELDTATGASPPYGHATFFQAPLGRSDIPSYGELKKILNTVGFYLDFTDGTEDLPDWYKPFSQERWRMRLYQFIQPSENLSVLEETTAAIKLGQEYTDRDWYLEALKDRALSRPIAENIVALILRPINFSDQVDLAPDYIYDSSGGLSGAAIDRQKHKLPPAIQLTVVAIDEDSARRLSKTDIEAIGEEANQLFEDQSDQYESRLTATSSNGGGNTLEDYLIQKRVAYRIYTSVIPIIGSKWN